MTILEILIYVLTMQTSLILFCKCVLHLIMCIINHNVLVEEKNTGNKRGGSFDNANSHVFRGL
jgi:hypothetical protein